MDPSPPMPLAQPSRRDDLECDARRRRATDDRRRARLGPGKEAPLTLTVDLPMLSPGRYHLIAVADSDASQTESTETNNRRATGFEVAVPALTVDALNLSPSVVQAGQTATASVRIANRGRVSSRPTTADVFMATSAAADLSEGIHLRTLAVDRLSPGASVTLPMPLGVPASTPAATT